MSRDITPREARLYAHMHVAESGCWEWTGATVNGGYGVMGIGRRGEGNVRVHRLAWEIWRGPIPDGMWVLHRCDNPPCFRPDHLFLGSHADNMADMTAKRRHRTQVRPESIARGERHGSAKLSEEEVRAIRALHAEGRTAAAIADQYGLSASTIGAIVRREGWSHVA